MKSFKINDKLAYIIIFSFGLVISVYLYVSYGYTMYVKKSYIEQEVCKKNICETLIIEKEEHFSLSKTPTKIIQKQSLKKYINKGQGGV